MSLDVETRGSPPLAPPPRVCGEVYLTLPYYAAVESYARVCCYQRTYNPSQLMAALAAAPVRAHKGGWGGDA